MPEQLVFAALIGLCVGSFCNVLIVRTPLGKSIIAPRSHCVDCLNKIAWWQNIPLISFFLLRGKCHYCKKPISALYPTVEAIVACIFVAIIGYVGFNVSGFLVACIFALLCVLCVIDLMYKAVPDSVSIFTLTLALIYVVVGSTYSIQEGLSNSLLVVGVLYLIRLYVSYAISQEAMGEGDIIIGGIMGALLGIQLSLVALFLSALLALPFSIYARFKGELELPFIPFLASATFLVFLFQNWLEGVVVHVFG